MLAEVNQHFHNVSTASGAPLFTVTVIGLLVVDYSLAGATPVPLSWGSLIWC